MSCAKIGHVKEATPAPDDLRFRAAGPGDTSAVAELHADSWRRHYRSAFSADFLDHDVAGYLRPVWAERLATPLCP